MLLQAFSGLYRHDCASRWTWDTTYLINFIFSPQLAQKLLERGNTESKMHITSIFFLWALSDVPPY